MTTTHDWLVIDFSIHLSSLMSTIESHIQVHSHSTSKSRNELCLRGGGGRYVCDKTAINAWSTSLIEHYCPTLIAGIYNLNLVHRLYVVAYCLTRDGLYMSITFPSICSSLVLSLFSLHSQTLWPGSLKLPSLSIIPPAMITYVIACCHNRKYLHGWLYFENRKVDHFSPTHLSFK